MINLKGQSVVNLMGGSLEIKTHFISHFVSLSQSHSFFYKLKYEPYSSHFCFFVCSSILSNNTRKFQFISTAHLIHLSKLYVYEKCPMRQVDKVSLSNCTHSLPVFWFFILSVENMFVII